MLEVCFKVQWNSRNPPVPPSASVGKVRKLLIKYLHTYQQLQNMMFRSRESQIIFKQEKHHTQSSSSSRKERLIVHKIVEQKTNGTQMKFYKILRMKILLRVHGAATFNYQKYKPPNWFTYFHLRPSDQVSYLIP